MFSDRKLFLNGPIPGSKKLFTRLTSPIPPIEADPQAECAAGEIPCGGFRLIKGTSIDDIGEERYFISKNSIETAESLSQKRFRSDTSAGDPD